MFDSSKIKIVIFICLALSILLGVILWTHSDLPPYGAPLNELSNGGWGLTVDTAHKWRNYQLSFWDRGIGGGCSLYESGQYPILSPFNAVAFLLNDDQFFLFIIIIPYVVGFLGSLLLFVDVFQLRWMSAVFGALIYISLGLGKWAVLAQQTILLWGAMLFPWMVFAYLKLKDRDMYLAAAIVGSLIAFLFALGGVIQYPQMIIWWLLFFVMEIFLADNKGFNLSKFRIWFFSSMLLIIMAIGIFAVQFIPTYHFTLSESARSSGYYQINNSLLFGSYRNSSSMYDTILNAFVREGTVSAKGMAALILMVIALVVANPGMRYFDLKQNNHRGFLFRVWLTTVIYFLIPPAAGTITSCLPALKAVFSPLSKFTFRYGMYTLDFCLTLTLCFILSNENLSMRRYVSRLRSTVAWLIFVSALGWVWLPFASKYLSSINSYFMKFVPAHFHYVVLLEGIFLIISFYLIFRPRHKMMALACGAALIIFGFMRLSSCYFWNDKGKRTEHLADYCLSCPEMQYFKSAQGKYLLPVDYFYPTIHNYGLLYGVHGTNGFLPIPPLRFAKFMAAYHNLEYFKKNEGDVGAWIRCKYGLTSPGEILPTYFPVDFTFIEHGKILPWKGFVRQVSGKYYDVWERSKETPPVMFAKARRCLDFAGAIRQFETVPFTDTIFLEDNDCAARGVQEINLSAAFDKDKRKPVYSNFQRIREDRIQFQVSTAVPTIVVIPEMYQAGWQAKANGRRIDLYPANYLFLGFDLLPGHYLIELKFYPPGLTEGVYATLGSVLLLGFLIFRYFQPKNCKIGREDI